MLAEIRRQRGRFLLLIFATAILVWATLFGRLNSQEFALLVAALSVSWLAAINCASRSVREDSTVDRVRRAVREEIGEVLEDRHIDAIIAETRGRSGSVRPIRN